MFEKTFYENVIKKKKKKKNILCIAYSTNYIVEDLVYCNEFFRNL